MSLILSAEEQDLLLALAAPIAPQRRPEFLDVVTARLEGADAIGPGAVHRTARSVLAQFWSPPPDLRTGSAQSRRTPGQNHGLDSNWTKKIKLLIRQHYFR